jgi:hypothetical protein
VSILARPAPDDAGERSELADAVDVEAGPHLDEGKAARAAPATRRGRDVGGPPGDVDEERPLRDPDADQVVAAVGGGTEDDVGPRASAPARSISDVRRAACGAERDHRAAARAMDGPARDGPAGWVRAAARSSDGPPAERKGRGA